MIAADFLLFSLASHSQPWENQSASPDTTSVDHMNSPRKLQPQPRQRGCTLQLR
jgi:hypothetical protein